MSEYTQVLTYLRAQAREIMSEWNGKFPGEKEYRATKAQDLLEAVDEVDKLVAELDI